MNLTESEKKLFGLLLDQFSDHLGSAGCNDLPKEYIDCLTEEEWDAVDKKFHELNGDPEEHRPGHPLLMDFMILYYLRKKVGL